MCVYLLKRSKTCISSWWPFTCMYVISAFPIDFYMVNKDQWIFSSVLDEQGNWFFVLTIFYMNVFYFISASFIGFYMVNMGPWICLQFWTSRGHGSLTPSHANEAMEFRPEENVDAHSCTCYSIVDDMVILLKHWSWGLDLFLKLFALPSRNKEHLLSWLRHWMP